MSQAAIAVDGLIKRYGERQVLDGVDLSVESGQVVALLGPNGAGKTTTVEIIEGYRSADGGSVRVLGSDPAQGGAAHRARVGLMLQGGGIDMRARPRETLIQYARFHAESRDPEELIELVGLGSVATTPYRRLSGGERQRLSLALALVGRPEAVILDEPTAGMDPEARVGIRAIIEDLRAAGVAVLLTSHDLADVERLADRIDILIAGRIEASGTVEALTAGTTSSVTFRLDRPLTDEDLGGLGLAAEGTVVEAADGGYRLDGRAPSPGVVESIAAWCSEHDRLLIELRTVGGSLEAAYLDLVARHRAEP